MKYGIVVQEVDGEFLISFADFPNVHSVAFEKDAIQKEALDALETAFEMMMEDGKSILLPSATTGACVLVPGVVAMKVYLWNEMWEQRKRKVDIANALGVHAPQIDRMLDMRHNTKFDTLEAALASLGKHVDVVLAA